MHYVYSHSNVYVVRYHQAEDDEDDDNEFSLG